MRSNHYATSPFATWYNYQVEARYINAYEVDTICSPISGKTIDFARFNYLHLRNLPLADRARGENLEIDALIGASHCWGSMLDHTVQGGGGTWPWTSCQPNLLRIRVKKGK